MRLTLIILLFLMPFLSSAAKIREKNIAGRKYCNVYDLMTRNGFRAFMSRNTTRATGKGVNCTFTRDTRSFLFNGTKVALLYNPVYEGSSSWISSLDWYKNLRPLLFPASVPRKRVTTIMIDMGHGGKDPGAIGAISREKNINLRIGRRVAEFLRANGFKVKMTRNSDVQISLDKIGDMQKRSGSDLFVSIHVNSTKSKSVSGIETFCITPAGAPSSNGGSSSKTVYQGNRNDPANLLLAWNIQRSLIARTDAVDRGVKRARFKVLQNINVPGVLVEVGFISNRSEERKLNDPAYIDKVARGIVDGIISFIRTTRPQ